MQQGRQLLNGDARLSADAPSTAMLRMAVPLPRFAGADNLGGRT